jgi:hypothetical protein
MNTKLFTRTSACLLVLLLAACSEAPKKTETKKEPPKPPEPVTGLTAFYEMYKTARNWAKDLEGLKLTSANLPDVKSESGKAGGWQAVFVSPSLRESRSFSFSAVEGPATRKGVSTGPSSSWSPKPTSKSFPLSAIKIDSDKAYEIALQKGADYAKKNPDKPITFLLEQTDRFPNPAWRVIWGESVGSSNFSIFVDATTGQYLRTVR